MTPDFYAHWQQQNWHDVEMQSMAFKAADVELALYKARHNTQLKLADFQ